VTDEEAKPIAEEVRGKYELTVEQIKQLTGHRELCEDSSTLRSMLSTRDPYTLPVNFLQVEILRRVRTSPDDEAMNDCLLLTVNGISAGMRNTG
jgi:phosphoenolpyruvate carboxylase